MDKLPDEMIILILKNLDYRNLLIVKDFSEPLKIEVEKIIDARKKYTIKTNFFLINWNGFDIPIYTEKHSIFTKKLSFVNEGFFRIPETIGNLTDLEELNLNSNKIIYLPESIGKLTNLINLNLANNRLEKLPETFGNLINLEILNLLNNNLLRLPNSFIKLQKLEELYMDQIPLTDELKIFIKNKSRW